jgi:sarcosine oxidase
MTDGSTVAIVGGGTMGTMAAWRLALRGVPAVCFEQFSPGHDRGAAGGETRIFGTAYPDDRRYVPLLQDSLRLWRDLELASGRELLTLNGVLTMGHPEQPKMMNAVRSIRDSEFPAEELSERQVGERYPQYRALPGDVIILDRGGGFLRADIALVEAAAQAEACGATIERYARVEALHIDRTGVTLKVDGRERSFAAAVVAVGAWTGQLLPQVAKFLTLKRPTQAWFAAREPHLTQPDRNPVLMRATAPAAGAYVLPSIDGRAVKMGLSHLLHEAVDDPSHLDRTITTAQMRKFREVAEVILPGVYPDPMRYGAYVEGYTPDEHALVGRWRGAEQVVLMCGFSGHGFRMAPVFGDIAADLIVDGWTSRLIAHLDPSRFLS